MAQTTLELRPQFASRVELERRAKRLAHLGNGWHLVEFAIALGAGIAAGSVALTAFAGDSLVEVLAASVIVWLFTAERGTSEHAERRAQQLVATSYVLLGSTTSSRRASRKQVGSVSGLPPSPRRRCRSSRARSERSVTRSARPRP